MKITTTDASAVNTNIQKDEDKSFQEKLHKLVSLVSTGMDSSTCTTSSSSCGKNENNKERQQFNSDQVESTIESILSQVLPSSLSKASTRINPSAYNRFDTSRCRGNSDKKKIELDEDNYDDEQVDDDNIMVDSNGGKAKKSSNKYVSKTIQEMNKEIRLDGSKIVIPLHQKNSCTTEQNDDVNANNKFNLLEKESKDLNNDEDEPIESGFTTTTNWTDLDQIPLGKIGARIMVTFGDGPKPNLNACALTLLVSLFELQHPFFLLFIE